MRRTVVLVLLWAGCSPRPEPTLPDVAPVVMPLQSASPAAEAPAAAADPETAELEALIAGEDDEPAGSAPAPADPIEAEER